MLEQVSQLSSQLNTLPHPAPSKSSNSSATQCNTVMCLTLRPWSRQGARPPGAGPSAPILCSIHEGGAFSASRPLELLRLLVPLSQDYFIDASSWVSISGAATADDCKFTSLGRSRSCALVSAPCKVELARHCIQRLLSPAGWIVQWRCRCPIVRRWVALLLFAKVHFEVGFGVVRLMCDESSALATRVSQATLHLKVLLLCALCWFGPGSRFHFWCRCLVVYPVCE